MSLEIGLILNEMLPVGSYIDGCQLLSLGNNSLKIFHVSFK